MAQSVGAIALDIVMGQNTVSSVARQAMQDVRQTFNNASATIKDKVSSVGTACKNLGASLAPVSAAATGVIKKTADAAMAFETAMAKVKTIAGNASVSYKGSMQTMDKAILQLSKDTGISAEQVAEATYSAISAGVDTAKSVEFVATANALATGGFTDMATSVDVLTTALNAYGDKAGTAQSISDKLITTQNLGKTTVNELASSMGKVIPSASAYGVSIDNLCSSYVEMTKGGIATAEATTYMKSMLNELGDSGSTVGKVLQEKTGKSFGQLMKDGKSLGDVIDILGKSVDGDKEKFAQLWGSSEAGTGALSILNGGAKEFNTTLKEMGKSSGSATEAMNKMNDTSAHKIQVAMNDIRTCAIELGGAFAPVVSKVAGYISKIATAFSNLNPKVKSVIATVLGIGAVIAPVLTVVGSIISGIGSVISAVGVIQGALTAFTGFISATVIPALGSFFAFLLANPIVLVIVAIVGAIALLIANWKKVKEVTANVWNGIKNIVSTVGNAIKNFVSNCWENIKATTTAVFNVVKTIIQTQMAIWKAIITTVMNAIKNVISSIWNGIKTVFSTIFNIIKTIIQTQFNIYKTIISTALNIIKSTVSTAWNAIKSVVSTVLNGIKTVVSTIWNGIKTVIKSVVNIIKALIKGDFEAVKQNIKTIMNTIRNTISTVWNTIKSTISNVLNTIKSAVSNIWNNIVNSIKKAMSNVFNAVKSGFSKVKSHITGLAKQAFTWGKDMIMGIVKGIKSCIGSVGNAVKGVANKIKSLLHFSRPDEGPLRDYETWMPDFMQGMANGINANKHKVIDEVKSMASQMMLPINGTSLQMQAPQLKNIGSGRVINAQTDNSDKLYTLLTQLVNTMQGGGDITIPIYLGNELIDERIVRASDRRTIRSGGRA